MRPVAFVFALIPISLFTQIFSRTLAADSSLSSWWRGDHASGDWGGHRQRLEERGVHLWLNYEQDLAGNVTGGDSRGVTNSGSIEAGAILDLGKLANISNTAVLIRFVDRNGTDLSLRRIGNFFPVQQDFGVETLMLQSLALEHTFAENSLSLKVGRVAAGDDFAGHAVYGLYMNNAINGAPKALFTTNAFSSYPGSVWGARIAYTAPEKTWYAKAGVYQANDRLYSGDKHGFQWDIRHNDGVTLVSEIGYTPGGRDDDTSATALPGHYAAGAYVSFWDTPRIDGLGTESTSHAFYFHADQMLWREAGRSITAWSAVVVAPKESVQVMPWQISAGLAYEGIFSARPRDQFVIGISHGHFGDDYDALQQAQNPDGGGVTGETVIELAWRFQLNRFNTLQPDVQYIINPAGFANRDNALVFGMRLNVVF